MHSVVLAVAVGILVIVAYEDVRTRRIPNIITTPINRMGSARPDRSRSLRTYSTTSRTGASPCLASVPNGREIAG